MRHLPVVLIKCILESAVSRYLYYSLNSCLGGGGVVQAVIKANVSW
jgi:hypothetical protein